MTPALNHLMLRAMDFLLGWTLALPRDLTLFIVALGSALVLIGARALTTNQELLGRCEADRAARGQSESGGRQTDRRRPCHAR